MVEQYTINDSGCFSYVGAMKHGTAVQYFNDMMKAGVWIDPDWAIENRPQWNYREKCRIRGKLETAFETQDEIYGELAFGIICFDRISGQFDEDEDFHGRE